MKAIFRTRTRLSAAFAALAVVIFSSTSDAADGQGRFHGMGAGIATCERFLEARASQSQESFMFGGWIDGYLSARNQLDSNTYSLAPWQTTDVLAGFIADYCAKKPDEVFLRAVMVMTKALMPARLTDQSERITVAVGSFKAAYFKATLLALQHRLRELGYYSGDIDGDFDATTSTALKAFQRATLIDPSGFPDQITLFKLFKPAS